MRHSALLTVLISFASVAPVKADELFSEVAMESVFQASTATTESESDDVSPVASKNVSGSVDRVTSVPSLVETLNTANLEAKDSDHHATLTLAHSRWKFPASIAVDVDRDRLDCRLTLAKIDGDTQLSNQTLLQLLAAGDHQGRSFAYDPSAKTLQVRASISNRSVTASGLKSELHAMAQLAEKQANLWSASPAANARSTSIASLSGRWSASLANNEAFAIQIAADARFQLVHVKAGKSTVSKGKVVRSGNQLKLVGDGDVTLDCTFDQSPEDAFELQIKNAQGGTAMTLNFKKAS